MGGGGLVLTRGGGGADETQGEGRRGLVLTRRVTGLICALCKEARKSGKTIFCSGAHRSPWAIFVVSPVVLGTALLDDIKTACISGKNNRILQQGTLANCLNERGLVVLFLWGCLLEELAPVAKACATAQRPATPVMPSRPVLFQAEPFLEFS